MTHIIPSSTVTVAGATGAQGGAATRALLERGRSVRALTRNPDSPAACQLRDAGAQVAYADFARPESLDSSLAGSAALFAVTTPFETDVEQEVRDGVSLLDAAAVAGVGHIVFSSAANADRATGIPHFDSKYRVEQHLVSLGVPWTVIAPAAFMDQYTESWTLDGLREGTFARPMPGDRPLALIPAVDIGSFAAMALSKPERFAGRRIDIASDELTGRQVAAVLGAACHREVHYAELPDEYIQRHSPDLAAMFRYFAATGLDVDVAELRREYPEVGWHSLTDWVAKQRWDLVPA
ncbi:MAG: NmrA/HSCARG family protein [Mycobacteriales bacterium]